MYFLTLVYGTQPRRWLQWLTPMRLTAFVMLLFGITIQAKLVGSVALASALLHNAGIPQSSLWLMFGGIPAAILLAVSYRDNGWLYLVVSLFCVMPILYITIFGAVELINTPTNPIAPIWYRLIVWFMLVYIQVRWWFQIKDSQ